MFHNFPQVSIGKQSPNAQGVKLSANNLNLNIGSNEKQPFESINKPPLKPRTLRPTPVAKAPPVTTTAQTSKKRVQFSEAHAKDTQKSQKTHSNTESNPFKWEGNTLHIDLDDLLSDGEENEYFNEPESLNEINDVEVIVGNKENELLDEEMLELAKYYTWQSSLEDARNYVPLATGYYLNSIYNIQEAKGPAMIKKVLQKVKSFFPRGRFYFQRELHSQVIRATLYQILGDEYTTTVDAVCKEYGWDGPKKNLFAIASRRSGKTTGMASIVAGLLLCIPKIQIVVYSVALRTAQEFVRLVERYLQMDAIGRGMIVNPGGSETLVLKGPSIGDIRRIRSFPSGGNAKNVSPFFYFHSH